ncbi:MAG: GPR1/FUN34/YaaH family transporter [Gordonia sp. (in: high G+C Gram-positive bacteria)]
MDHDVAAKLPPDPAAIGVPPFVVGALVLGLVQTGFVPATAVGASLPILLAATSVGQFVAALRASSLGMNAETGIFTVFSGFWLSYAMLVLGLTHHWWGITPDAIAKTEEVFVVAWLVVVVLLILATLRLPLAFTALFTLVAVSLALSLIGTAKESAGIREAGGWVVIAVAAVGAYLFVDTMWKSTGGKPLPMGRPVITT